MSDYIINAYDAYKRQLRDCENNFDVLRFIAKMLIEIWYEVSE